MPVEANSCVALLFLSKRHLERSAEGLADVTAVIMLAVTISSNMRTEVVY